MSGYDPLAPMAAGLGIFLVLMYLGILGISIYCFILFIRVAHRGIKALDIYINKNGRPSYPPQNFNNQAYYGGQNTASPGQQPMRNEVPRKEG